MNQSTKGSKDSNSKDNNEFKDDEIAPKGRTQHTIEPHWPIKESTPIKKKKIKNTRIARLP